MPPPLRSPLRTGEGAFVAALAVLAGARVLLLCAALPFFTNVDEHRHVDGVLKYARGYLPAPDNSDYEPETGRYLGLYGSPEFHLKPGPGGAYVVPPPLWERPAESTSQRIDRTEAYLARRTNIEAMQPPAYYAAAAVWLRVGSALGLQGAVLLYWVRALAAPLLFGLVWLAYRSLREVYPDDAFMRLGVPVLLAVFPLDVFYYVTRDALSPLVAGVGFLWAARLATASEPDRTAPWRTGLAAVIAFFAKYTNVALLVVTALCTALALRAREGARRLRGEGGRLLAMWVLIALPIGAWLLRNQLVFGEVTATAFKIERMGWGRRPLGVYFHHPLFTIDGFAVFVRELVPIFWRGEVAWHRVPLAIPAADAFYTVTTLVFLAFAAYGLFRGQRPAERRTTEALALLLVGGYVAGLALMSPLYIFHATSNPSAAMPYFVQGRLISGAVLPFVLLYLRGIQVATGAFPERFAKPIAWGALALVVAVAAGSEVWLHLPIFASPYNFYHLP